MTMLSAGFALARTESAVLGPAQGYLIDRLGPRAIMRVGVLLFGLGFVLLSLIQQPWQFFLAIIVLAIGASFAGFLSVTVTVVKWFRRRRATALGMASSGTALGGLLVPAVTIFMSTYGWRAASLWSGVLVLVIGPFVVQVMRHQPSDLGLEVDGLPNDDEKVVVAAGVEGTYATGTGSASLVADFTAKQALRTAAFWQISFGHGLAVMLISALMVHLIPHLTGQLGYSLGFAGLIVALVTLMQLVGMVVGGVLGDRLSKRVIVSTAMVMHAGAALLLTVAVTPLLVVGFAMIHGLAWVARGPLQQAWRADLFGSRYFGAIMGFSSIVVMLGAAGGPLLAGILFDQLGDYILTLRLLALLALLGALLFLLVRRPAPPTAIRET
jgi:MFS family permease